MGIILQSFIEREVVYWNDPQEGIFLPTTEPNYQFVTGVALRTPGSD